MTAQNLTSPNITKTGSTNTGQTNTGQTNTGQTNTGQTNTGQTMTDRLEITDPKVAAPFVKAPISGYLAQFIGVRAGVKLNTMAYWAQRFAKLGLICVTRIETRGGSAIEHYQFPGTTACAPIEFSGLETLPNGTRIPTSSTSAEQQVILEIQTRAQTRAQTRVNNIFDAPRAKPIVVFLNNPATIEGLAMRVDFRSRYNSSQVVDANWPRCEHLS